MKSRYTALLIAGAVVVSACAEVPTMNAPASLTRHGSIAFNAEAAGDNTYLVRFKGKGVPAGFAATVESLGGEVVFAHAGAGVAAVAGLSDASVDVLAATDGIAGVDADMYTTLDLPSETQTTSFTDVSSPTAPQTAIAYFAQWNMRAISARAAWDAGRLGSPATKVGILDTGLGYTHADLVGRVDLANSKSFLSTMENARVQAAFPGAHEVADLHYHGTHVGATVASNAIWAAGLTSQTTLVGLKVCKPGFPNPVPAQNFAATCDISAVLSALLYAADLGLPVVNMSLGGLFTRSGASARGGFGPSFIATLNAVFHYVEQKGTLVVVASGNTPVDLQRFGFGLYGAYCDAPGVICVSATGPTSSVNLVSGPFTNVDAIAPYSTIGKTHVTVAAPGGTTSGFIWAACSPFSLAIPTCPSLILVGSIGTSMAAPHVAGLAALIAAEGGHTPSSITKRITSSADDLGPAGRDAGYGFGRINVARALGL